MIRHDIHLCVIMSLMSYGFFNFVACIYRRIVTTCFSGEVKLWSSEDWSCLSVTQAPMAQQHHVSNCWHFILLLKNFHVYMCVAGMET